MEDHIFFEHQYDLRYGNVTVSAGSVGGQGGMKKTTDWQAETSGGDGGIAGKGGFIKVASNAKVYAFNGNKYTDNTAYNNGQNQCEIFIQNGILRAIYKLNSFWNLKENHNSSYYNNIFGDDILESAKSIERPETYSDIENLLIREEIVESNSRKIKSGYINTNNNSIYGVGSGAGYIELSNGTYTIDENMN